MKTQIEITTQDDGTITVAGPYSGSNNTLWRSLGGRFVSGAWSLPDNDVTRAALAERFGAKSETVEVLIEDSSARDGEDGSVSQIGGYVLASRRGRDYAVRLADGVAISEGRFPASGGSVKNPRLCADGVVYRVAVRRSFAEARGLKIQTAPVAGNRIEV